MLRHTNTYKTKRYGGIVPLLNTIIALLLLIFIPVHGQISAEDFQQRITNSPWQDEWLWLDQELDSFGLWQWHRTPSPKGLLIIFHGPGQHADWPDLIRNIRLELPRSGWATFSVQLPANLSQDQVNRLINQALQQGAERNILNTALMAVGAQSNQVLSFGVNQAPRLDNFGLYFISYYWQPLEGFDAADLMGRLQYPLLDIWHGNDWHRVQAVQRRGAATRRQNPNYLQIENTHPPARTGVQADRDMRRVWGWLQSNSQGTEARRAN